MKNTFVVSITIFILAGCVSVNLPGSKAERADNVNFQEPAHPFQSLTVRGTDKAWVSKETGNTISYTSDCNNPSDPNLEQLQMDSLNAMSDLKIVSTTELDFNNRSARLATADGTLDGVPVKMTLLVFKKNNCNFTLSYGGVTKNFSAEHNHFEDFKRGFQAP